MEVQVISREVIKPAALLNGLEETFKLSYLDVFSPESYTPPPPPPLTIFYSMKQTTDAQDATARLKLSLSETLVRFPMLAGKIKGDSIDCSDEDAGALFVEATVKGTMADFLGKLDLQLLMQFIPFSLLLNEPLETAVQVAAQVNVFSCGGIAIGLSFLHKIIDATTMSAFVKSWAASSEGTSEKLVCGRYSSTSSLFPARDISIGSYLSPETPSLVQEGESSSTRRFFFYAVAISSLKAKARSSIVPNPTSVEAVTCFIWKYAMKASRSRSLDKKEEHVASFVDSKWQSVLVHAVNMRRRILQPPLSELDVGNILWRSHACYEASNTDTNLADLETILRQSLSEINNDFIQKVTGDNGLETRLSSYSQLNELHAKSSQSYGFTSWCNMGFNDVNFGWGKPVWIGYGGCILDSILKNGVLLMDTTTGREQRGIESWITLEDETMNLLENDSSFFSLLLPTQPSHSPKSNRFISSSIYQNKSISSFFLSLAIVLMFLNFMFK